MVNGKRNICIAPQKNRHPHTCPAVQGHPYVNQIRQQHRRPNKGKIGKSKTKGPAFISHNEHI
jgi:hypothetical protein